MADSAVDTGLGGHQETDVRVPHFRLLGPAGRFWISLTTVVSLMCVGLGLRNLFHVSADTFDTVAGYVAENVGLLVYVVLTYLLFRFEPAERIRARALATVRRGRFRAFLTVLFCAFLVGGTMYTAVVDLPHANVTAPDATGVATALISVNVLLSWLVIHAVYAEFYAKKYYRENGGLNFAGTDSPGYRDFAYFSYAIGMTFGTTDVAVTNSRFRHMMLPHKLLSFAFNTAILALVFQVLFK